MNVHIRIDLISRSNFSVELSCSAVKTLQINSDKPPPFKLSKPLPLKSL